MTPSLVEVVTPISEPLFGRVHVLERPVGLLRARPQRLKRLFDLAFAAALAVLVLPLMSVIAVAVVVESGRPVLFAHTRIGRGRQRFRLWKFRSMVPDADEVLWRHLSAHSSHAAEWRLTRKLRSDPRVTRVGRFLRRTSLDELPQLWNVLRGDMSLVGPRPVVEDELANYGRDAELYLRVLPGLTGLWQVSGRNDTSYRRRVKLDAHYVRNWSAALDALVLLRTVRVVIAGKGAY